MIATLRFIISVVIVAAGIVAFTIIGGHEDFANVHYWLTTILIALVVAGLNLGANTVLS